MSNPRYYERIAAGLCGLCGVEPLVTSCVCAQCRIRQAAYRRRYHQKRKVSRLCQWHACPAKPVPGRALCQAHLAKGREKRRAQVAKLLAAGLCVTCGKRPCEQGQRCLGCADMMLQRQRNRVAAKRARGECAWSGCARPAEGRHYCEYHREYFKKEYRRRLAEK